jgi:hypothetical protein
LPALLAPPISQIQRPASRRKRKPGVEENYQFDRPATVRPSGNCETRAIGEYCRTGAGQLAAAGEVTREALELFGDGHDSRPRTDFTVGEPQPGERRTAGEVPAVSYFYCARQSIFAPRRFRSNACVIDALSTIRAHVCSVASDNAASRRLASRHVERLSIGHDAHDRLAATIRRTTSE